MPERALVHQPDPSPRADRNVATRLQRISTEEKSGRTAAGNLCGTIGGSLGHGNSVILIHGLLNRTATKTGDHVVTASAPSISPIRFTSFTTGPPANSTIDIPHW